MLPPTSPREVLFTCPPPSPWNPPSFIVELTLSSACSRSEPSLAHLDSLPSHDLVFWTDGSVLFPFDKDGSGVLANCSLRGAEAILSFSAGPARSSFCAETCAILQALRYYRQHQQTSYFSSPLRRLSLCPLLHLSFCLKLSSTSGSNYLRSSCVLSGYNGSQNTHFSWKTTQLLSWSGGLQCFCLLHFLVVSLLLPLVSTLFFSRIGSALSHLNSSTHRFPRCPLRYLYSLVTLTACSLVFAATDIAFKTYLCRIGRIKNPSCNLCAHPTQDTFHLILHSPAKHSLHGTLFSNSLSLCGLWFRP